MKRLYSDNAGEAQAQAQSSASLVAGSKPKTKRVRRSVPKEKSQDMSTPGRRSSIYRGVTRHRWTGRYEAHLWDKNCWNQAQNKKGRQVYLGAYDDEEAAAHTYDLAALKYWGTETILNFPLNTYAKELEEMLSVSKEEYLASLRRRSSGFSRGVSKYRGVARHHHNGRWEARIGRVFGNKYLYLGTYSTQEEAAAAYDMAAIEYRGLNAVTNFDLSRYIRWLRPGQINGASSEESGLSPASASNLQTENAASTQHAEAQDNNNNQNNNLYKMQPSWKTTVAPQISYDEMQIIASQQPARINTNGSSAPSALGILLQSTKFKEMMEKASVNNSTRSIAGHREADLSQSCDTLDTCFSDDIDIFDFDSSGHNNILLENIDLDQAGNIMSQLNGVDSPHDHLNNITQNNVFQGVQAAAADDHFLQLHHDHQMPLELHEIYSGELLGLDQQDDIDDYSLIDPMSTINPNISFPFAIRTCS